MAVISCGPGKRPFEVSKISPRAYHPLNMDAIQIIRAITTITDIMPTTAPALKCR